MFTILSTIAFAETPAPAPAPTPVPAPVAATFKEYRTLDAAACKATPPTCAVGTVFSDAAGCGCVLPRREPGGMCTMDVAPVCAKFEDGTAKTASNLCGASMLPKIVETRPGKCP